MSLRHKIYIMQYLLTKFQSALKNLYYHLLLQKKLAPIFLTSRQGNKSSLLKCFPKKMCHPKVLSSKKVFTLMCSSLKKVFSLKLSALKKCSPLSVLSQKSVYLRVYFSKKVFSKKVFSSCIIGRTRVPIVVGHMIGYNQLPVSAEGRV